MNEESPIATTGAVGKPAEADKSVLSAGSLPTETPISIIRRLAIAKLTANTSSEDLEKLSSLFKNISEVETQKETSDQQRRSRWLQGLQGFSLLIVPLASLLTVLVTIIIQNSQIKATRDANEDTQWRDALQAQSVSHSDPLADLTADARLKSFFNSTRYRDQAYDMAKIMLGHMTNEEGFRDLYQAAYGSAGWVNIAAIADIDRDLSHTFWELDSKIDEMSKQPTPAMVQFPLPTMPPPGIRSSVPPQPPMLLPRGLPPMPSQIPRAGLPMTKDEAESLRTEVLNELGFLASEICSVLIQPRTPDWATTALNLSDTFLIDADCSKADFTHTQLASARLERVNLTNAILRPDSFKDSTWISSSWWEAAEIDKDLLTTLKIDQYPYHVVGEFDPSSNSSTAPDKTDYTKKVQSLCQKMGAVCDPNSIPFGEPSASPTT